MRTEILNQVATLQVESTFLHLRLAANKSELGNSREGRMLCSNDSPAVTPQYEDDCEHQGSRDRQGTIYHFSQAAGYHLHCVEDLIYVNQSHC